MWKIHCEKEKKELLENELTERVDKPRDLWKALKLYGLTNKSGGYKISAPVENQTVKHSIKEILTFKNFYSNQAGTLLKKHP